MKRIIKPIPRDLLKTELTDDKFLRNTNFGNNKIYSVNYHNSPNVLREIGRLRELAFRSAGGGTGKELDIDEYDTAEQPYQQLIVWDPHKEEIVGGYRYILCSNAMKDSDGNLMLATKRLFNFSEKFINEYLPYTIELGRSFVQPNYQSSLPDRSKIFALDNLWDGLGSLIIAYPNVKYFFGKVTMYTDFNRRARDMILFFLKEQFSDSDNLVTPIEPLQTETPEEELKTIFVGKDYKENYKILLQNVRALGENIPPLINSYMNLSPTMKVFGTSMNNHFGYVEETGILVTIDDIYEKKKERHLNMIRLKNAWKKIKNIKAYPVKKSK
ncbi:MAG: GNAT family N-acetyltransferase [Marinilabiliales bacterium]